MTAWFLTYLTLATQQPDQVVSLTSPLKSEIIHSYRCTLKKTSDGRIFLPKPMSESWQQVIAAKTDQEARLIKSDLFNQEIWLSEQKNTPELSLTARTAVSLSNIEIDEEKAMAVDWDKVKETTRYPVPGVPEIEQEGLRAYAQGLRTSSRGPYQALRNAYLKIRNSQIESRQKLSRILFIARELGLPSRKVRIVRPSVEANGAVQTLDIGESKIPLVGWVPFDPNAERYPTPKNSSAPSFGSFQSNQWVRLHVGDFHDSGKLKVTFSNEYWGNAHSPDIASQKIDLRYSAPLDIPWTDPVRDNRPIAVLLVQFSDSLTPSFSKEDVQRILLGPGFPSYDDYLRISSYNRLSLSGSQVFGPFRLSESSDVYRKAPGVDYDSAKHQRLTGDAVKAAGKSVDLRKFKSVLIIYPGVGGKITGNAAPIGVQGGGRYYIECGEEVVDGRHETNFGKVALGGALIHFPISHPLGIIVHEVGHSFGLDHSWDLQKRQNPFDGMGAATSVVHPIVKNLYPTYNAWHRMQLGVFNDGEVADIYSGERRSLELLPLNSTAKGVKALRVWKKSKREFIVAEVRQRDNQYDAGIGDTGLHIYDVRPARTGHPSNPNAAHVDRVSAVFQHSPKGIYRNWSETTYSSDGIAISSRSNANGSQTVTVSNGSN